MPCTIPRVTRAGPCPRGHSSCSGVHGRVKSTRQRATLSGRKGGGMVRRLNGQLDDGLSELLRGIDVRSAVYCVSELTAPWGFRVEDSSVPKFHLVLEGACVLTLVT